MSGRQAELPSEREQLHIDGPLHKRSITSLGYSINFQNQYPFEPDENSSSLMPELSHDILSLTSGYTPGTPQEQLPSHPPPEDGFHDYVQELDHQRFLQDEQLFQPASWDQPQVSITPFNDSLQHFNLQDFEDTTGVGDANWEEYLRIVSPPSDSGHLFVDRRDSVFSVLSTASSEREERPEPVPCFAAGPAEEEKLSTNVSADEKEQKAIEKPKKRTRASPEQLAVLEETFLTNTSPNAKLREYLAGRLNMSERSVQIWFQNRRAKVKKAAKKAQEKRDEEMIKQLLVNSPHQTFYTPLGVQLNSAAPSSGRLHPNTGPPTMDRIGVCSASQSPGFQPVHCTATEGGRFVPNVARMFGSHPNGTAVKTLFRGQQLNLEGTTSPAFAMKNGCPLFSCIALAIGTWTRVSSDAGELYCGYQPSARTFRYEISDHGVCFKMELPFASVSRLELLVHPAQAPVLGAPRIPQSLGQLVLDVVRPPEFFMMQPNAPTVGLRGTAQFNWARCGDFTEGRQATLSSRHVIKGDAHTLMAQLNHLCNLCPEVRKILVQHNHFPRHHLAQRYHPRPLDQRRHSLHQMAPYKQQQQHQQRGLLVPLSRKASAPSPLQMQSTVPSTLSATMPATDQLVRQQ